MIQIFSLIGTDDSNILNQQNDYKLTSICNNKMEKQIYHDLGTPNFRDPKNTPLWEIGAFHPAVSGIDGIEYLGRNTSLDCRNGTAKYQLKCVEITHFQEIEPEYEIIGVKLKGEDEAILGEVEKIIKVSILPK